MPPAITPSTFTADAEPDKKKKIQAASDDTSRHTLPRQRNDDKVNYATVVVVVSRGV